MNRLKRNKVKFLKVLFFLGFFISLTQEHKATNLRGGMGSIIEKSAVGGSALMTFSVLIYIWRDTVKDIFKLIKRPLLNYYKKKYFERSRSFNPFNEKEITQIENIIDKVLDSIVGHAKAKKKIKNIIITDLVKKFKNRKFGLKSNVASILEIYGKPGIGKSELVNNLCKILCRGKEPYIVTTAMIDQKSKRTIVEQLLYSDERNIYFSDLYHYIKAVPHGIVIFDEFDKIWHMDPVGLTEFFRGILDHGFINVAGEKLDCKNLSVFITFNKYGDEGIAHDEAYLSRIQLIKFKELTADDTSMITKRRLKEMNDSFSEKYGISLVYDDEFIKKIGNDIAQQKKGYRPGNMLLDSLSSRVFLLWVGNNYEPLNVELELIYSDDFISFTKKEKEPKDENNPDSLKNMAA